MLKYKIYHFGSCGQQITFRAFCLKTIWRQSITISTLLTERIRNICYSAAYSEIQHSTLSLCIETGVSVQHANIKRRLVIRAVLWNDILFRKTEINHWLFSDTLTCYSFHVYVHHSIEMNHNMGIQRYLLFYSKAVLHLGEWMSADYRCNLKSAENI